MHLSAIDIHKFPSFQSMLLLLFSTIIITESQCNNTLTKHKMKQNQSKSMKKETNRL